MTGRTGRDPSCLRMTNKKRCHAELSLSKLSRRVEASSLLTKVQVRFAGYGASVQIVKFKFRDQFQAAAGERAYFSRVGRCGLALAVVSLCRVVEDHITPRYFIAEGYAAGNGVHLFGAGAVGIKLETGDPVTETFAGNRRLYAVGKLACTVAGKVPGAVDAAG